MTIKFEGSGKGASIGQNKNSPKNQGA